MHLDDEVLTPITSFRSLVLTCWVLVAGASFSLLPTLPHFPFFRQETLTGLRREPVYLPTATFGLPLPETGRRHCSAAVCLAPSLPASAPSSPLAVGCIPLLARPPPRPAIRGRLYRPEDSSTAAATGWHPVPLASTGRRGRCGSLGIGLAGVAIAAAGARPQVAARPAHCWRRRCSDSRTRHKDDEVAAPMRLPGGRLLQVPQTPVIHLLVAAVAASTVGRRLMPLTVVTDQSARPLPLPAHTRFVAGELYAVPPSRTGGYSPVNVVDCRPLSDPDAVCLWRAPVGRGPPHCDFVARHPGV